MGDAPTPPEPLAASVLWAAAQAAGADGGTAPGLAPLDRSSPSAVADDAGVAIPEDDALLPLFLASAYTAEGRHRQTLTTAQSMGAAPADLPALLWICCQRLRPELALLIGHGHYPKALSADPCARMGGALVSGAGALSYFVERMPAEALADT